MHQQAGISADEFYEVGCVVSPISIVLMVFGVSLQSHY